MYKLPEKYVGFRDATICNTLLCTFSFCEDCEVDLSESLCPCNIIQQNKNEHSKLFLFLCCIQFLFTMEQNVYKLTDAVPVSVSFIAWSVCVLESTYIYLAFNFQFYVILNFTWNFIHLNVSYDYLFVHFQVSVMSEHFTTLLAHILFNASTTALQFMQSPVCVVLKLHVTMHTHNCWLIQLEKKPKKPQLTSSHLYFS